MKNLPAILFVIGYWLLVIGSPQPVSAQVTEFPPPPAECSLDKPHEIRPSCAVCGEILFCWGNNYRACTTGRAFPAPALGTENRSGYLGLAGEIITYNGQSFTVPEGGLFFCDSNVFGCANPRCRGEQPGEGGLTRALYEGTTEIALSKDPRFGSTIEYKKDISVTGNQQGITSVNPLSTLVAIIGDKAISAISRIKAFAPEGSAEEKFPAPQFPFLSVLPEINRRLAPAGYNPKIETEQIKSYSYSPGCRVTFEQINQPAKKEEQKALAAIISSSDVRINAQGKIEYNMPPEWGEQIANSKITQAIFVPGKGIKSEIVVKNPPPPGEEHNEYLGGNCPTGTGVPVAKAENAAQGETVVPSEDSLFDGIRNFLSGVIDVLTIFTRPLTQPATIQLTHVDKNVCVGCSDLGQSITGPEGFVNAFLPQAETVSLADAELPATKGIEASPGIEQKVTALFADDGNIGLAWNKLRRAVTPLRFQTDISGFSPTLLNLPPVLDHQKRLTYEIPMDFPVEISATKRQEVIAAVEASWGENTLIRENWDVVYNRARDAGINPAFAIAIWIEESGASDPEVNAASDFGWAPHLRPTFEESLSGFIDFTLKRPSDFERWARDFCGPNNPYICSNNPNFLKNLKYWYDFIVPQGNPGASRPR